MVLLGVFLKFYLFLAVLGLCCFRAGFLQLQRAEGTLRWGAQALGSWASLVAALGLRNFGLWALEQDLRSKWGMG